MSRNNWILPTIIAGGALYYYDQNVDPIISSRFQGQKVAVQQKARDAEKQSKKVPDQLKDAKDSAVDKTKPYIDDIQKSIEQQYNKLEAKTSELSDKFKSSFSTAEKDLRNLNVDNRNFLHKTVAGYLDWINHVGEKGAANAPEPRKIETQAQTSWWPWAQETAEQKKARAIKNYEQSKATFEDLTTKAKSKVGLTKDEQTHLQKAQNDFNSAFENLKKFGSVTFEEQRAYAEDHYKEAKKKFDDLTAQFNNKTSLTPEEKRHYENAKSEFGNAFTSLKKYGSNVVDRVDRDYYQPLKEKAFGK